MILELSVVGGANKKSCLAIALHHHSTQTLGSPSAVNNKSQKSASTSEINKPHVTAVS